MNTNVQTESTTAPKNAAVPLVALDEVLEVGTRSIRTRKRIDAAEPYFAGHYPGNPIYPGIFIVEAVVQAVRAYLESEGRRGHLVEVVSTRFLAPVQPGDVLEVECEFTPSAASAEELLVKAVCSKADTKAANVKLRFLLENDHA